MGIRSSLCTSRATGWGSGTLDGHRACGRGGGVAGRRVAQLPPGPAVTVRLRFSFLGETQVDRSLARFEKVDDMRPVWRRLKERFVAYETDTFASSGRGGWPPLSPPYAAWKGRHFPGKPVLRREDELFHSLTDRLDIDIEEPGFAIFGTADPVAVFHQKGMGRLPVRKVVDLSESERQEWVRTVQEWLVSEAPS